MDSVADELELTKDTMKLLHKELKMLRTQLHEQNERRSESSGVGSNFRDRANAAEAEVISLREEITNLRNHNASLQDDLELFRGGLNPDEKSLVLQYKVSHDSLSEQLQNAMEDNERLNHEKDEKDRAQTELHHKFSSFREKYKTMKVTNRELQSALDVLHHDLVEMTGQRDEAEDRVKTEEKVCTPFDLVEFLSSSEPTVVKGQPALSEIKPYSWKNPFSISQAAQKHCADIIDMRLSASDGFFALNKNEMVWSSTDTGTGLAVMPCHRYNPKSNAWERENLGFNVGQQKSMFYWDKSWHYLGTYECVSAGTIDLLKLRQLDQTAVRALYKNTLRFPDLVPPFLRNMIPAMYSVDVLKVAYIAIRCVGFNDDLYSILLKKSIKNTDTHITFPVDTATTRTKRSISNSTNEGISRKKAKR